MSETAALKHRTAWLSIFSNTTLVVLKLIVGLYVGAVSLISEALHSGTDLIAALIAFWAVRKSDAPPDLEHDYGHGKYENLSAAVEALLIVGAAIGIVYEAVNKFATGEVPETLSYGIAIMIVAIVVNFAVSRRLLYVAKITGSQALEADGLHLTADIWTSVGVLIGLLLMQLTGWAWLDPVIAIFVAGIIFRAGWRMVVESTRELTDESLPAEDEARIGAIFDEIPEVRGWHCLRTRKSGSYKLLDVHILFDGNMHLARVHAVCDEIEQKIRAEFGTFDVLIHPEPDMGHAEETKQSVYQEAHTATLQPPSLRGEGPEGRGESPASQNK
ncbi:cation diffusion facilitator family transporter [uncultured Selenomonas sp.]|jgi:cation diffusion facilitator family transporter|uniref:cation diffusion facilitator family transporter n=1 Tax=uncultured Selenomonas sp. TaxID=159275 RepID=UPI0025E13957|nr:cation diffusion facilitator family transporter [uncultured Selenomonas sp.]MDD6127177.1 cation diffusion facilitator family transporter [Veillonellaceae bacterium]MDD6697968.1 cation diffusion facilitator family transporter [Veillonellaceae bacterium]